MAGERKNFAGAAVQTTLAADIVSTADGITVTVASDAGWPTDTTYPHVMVVDAGGAGEEKMLVKRTGSNTFVVQTGGRGYDGTTAATHSTGVTVEHRADADTLTRLTQHAFGDALGDHDTEYRRKDVAVVSADITSLAGSKVTGTVPAASTAASADTATKLTADANVTPQGESITGYPQTITTEADVVDCTITITTPRANMVYVVLGHFDVQITKADTGNDVFLGILNVDGSNETRLAYLAWDPNDSSAVLRMTVSQMWVVTLASAGSHTLKLRAKQLSGNGTIALQQHGNIDIVHAYG